MRNQLIFVGNPMELNKSVPKRYTKSSKFDFIENFITISLKVFYQGTTISHEKHRISTTNWKFSQKITTIYENLHISTSDYNLLQFNTTKV